jgi:hypothetical protein
MQPHRNLICMWFVVAHPQGGVWNYPRLLAVCVCVCVGGGDVLKDSEGTYHRGIDCVAVTSVSQACRH